MRIVFTYFFACWSLGITASSIDVWISQDSIQSTTPLYNELDYLEWYEDTSDLSPANLDEGILESYKGNPNFDYTDQVKNTSLWNSITSFFSRIWNWFIDALFGDSVVTGFWAGFLEILPYIAIATLIGILVYLFIKLAPDSFNGRHKKTGEVNISEEEELIRNADLDALWKKAMESGDFRLATRYLYLKALKVLEEKEIIKIRNEKTNRDYVNEVASKDCHITFKELTRDYNFVWYGGFLVDIEGYQAIERRFHSLENAMNDE